MLTIGSLFSGIGGLELGLERAGLGPVKWQVELDPYCRAVLAKHWPSARRYEDVRTVGAGLDPVEIICGGFPCQDLSRGGNLHRDQLGLDGARSGLWSEYARIIGVVRPRYVVVENVTDLAWNGLDRVLADLAGHGYDAVWFPCAAADVGAPHLRDRLFVVANLVRVGVAGLRESQSPREDRHAERREGVWWPRSESDLRPVFDAPHERGDRWPRPVIRRVDDGFSSSVDWRSRIHALGNAVVPAVAEVVGWVVRGIHERLTQCC